MSHPKRTKILCLAVILLSAITLNAQNYSNDFENGYTWYPPWTNIVITTDSIAVDSINFDSIPTVHQHYCLCDANMEFGLGFSLAVPDSLHGRNLHLRYQADYRYPDTIGYGEIVFSLMRNSKPLVWQSYPLTEHANDSAQWFQASFDIDLPADYLTESTLNAYLWNNHQDRILIDNASITLTPWQLPSFLPNPLLVENGKLSTFHFPLSTFHFQLSTDTTPLTYPIGMVTEYILNSDTLTSYQPFIKQESSNSYMAVSEIDTSYANIVFRGNSCIIPISSTFQKDCKLLRQAVVIPFIDSTLTIYRRNFKTENGERRTENSEIKQKEYYLDREGFKVGKGDRSIISYHQVDVTSTQFDIEQQVAYFNLDYWRDHPLIYYPMSDTLEDYFEDRSCRDIFEGMQWHHFIVLDIGSDIKHLPRIMPVPYGYEAGIIFTEHADWTDIRTHRAVLFGNEHITKAKNATGGFVFYGIPVTKSVFYNNPDQITNNEISHGTFPGLQTTIKTDREFEKTLRELHKIGFDICLHTPEQYTTTQSNLKEALDYMERNFQSTTWIDHGYNNGPEKNREDLVCDGLNRISDAFAADQWKSHGIKYLWNAYYEENRLEKWYFDNNLMQPYPGFGDALPNRQITLLEPIVPPLTPHSSLLTWCTSSTLDASSDLDWDYYYSEERLQRLVDHHSVHINHTYPAWVKPGRTFWTYDEDSTIVALPGMNRALARIADFRERHLILPMTVKTYLDYYSGLLQVQYIIIDSTHIRLYNPSNNNIKGFTLLCPTPIRFEDNRFYEFKKTSDGYYVWFDLKKGDEVIITIEN